MPVWKFRTMEDAERALWTTSDDPALPRRIRNLWSRRSLAGPLDGPRGVLKYRSIEDANADRDRWEAARVARIRERAAK
jgi:hypothetical protein